MLVHMLRHFIIKCHIHHAKNTLQHTLETYKQLNTKRRKAWVNDL